MRRNDPIDRHALLVRSRGSRLLRMARLLTAERSEVAACLRQPLPRNRQRRGSINRDHLPSGGAQDGLGDRGLAGRCLAGDAVTALPVGSWVVAVTTLRSCAACLVIGQLIAS